MAKGAVTILCWPERLSTCTRQEHDREPLAIYYEIPSDIGRYRVPAARAPGDASAAPTADPTVPRPHTRAVSGMPIQRLSFIARGQAPTHSGSSRVGRWRGASQPFSIGWVRGAALPLP